MATRMRSSTKEWVRRPPPDADPRTTTPQKRVGTALAAAGFVVVLVASIGNWTAAGDLAAGADIADTLAWTFTATTSGFALAKLGIGIILAGIIVRIWHRANAVGTALAHLRAEPDAATSGPSGDHEHEYGPATTHDGVPELLPPHRMAKRMWLPMLVMGAVAVAIGLVLGLSASGSEGVALRELSAWTQGTMFLGEGLLLAGISFLLGSIMANLRTAGSEVQDALGVQVTTLKMPAAAKAFLVLLMIGLLMIVTQFIGYVIAAGSAGDPASYAELTAWLGPFRETALGVILSGIVLALIAIGNALGFQFSRVKQLITIGA